MRGLSLCQLLEAAYARWLTVAHWKPAYDIFRSPLLPLVAILHSLPLTLLSPSYKDPYNPDPSDSLL
jgi:hypothetical protein